jgi:hypothetical protein
MSQHGLVFTASASRQSHKASLHAGTTHQAASPAAGQQPQHAAGRCLPPGSIT